MENIEKVLEKNGKFEYVRSGNRGRDKKGVLLAIPYGDQLAIGWSLCHKVEDEFDPDFGVRIAHDRALVWYDKNVLFNKGKWNISDKIIPQSIVRQLANFVYRMGRYYKDKKMPGWIEPLMAVAAGAKN